jgi:hypothetical protein
VHSRLARQARLLFVGIVEPDLSDSARTNEAKPYAGLALSVGASEAAFKANEGKLPEYPGLTAPS